MNSDSSASGSEESDALDEDAVSVKSTPRPKSGQPDGLTRQEAFAAHGDAAPNGV